MEDYPKVYGRCLIRLADTKKYLTLITKDDLGKLTQRDENSYYLVLTSEKSKAMKWEFIWNEDGTVTVAGERNGTKYYMCCHSFYPGDNRDENSKYVLAHNDSNIPNTHWRLIQNQNGVSFEQAGDQFNLQGFRLGCHDFYKYDKVASGEMQRADQLFDGDSDWLNCMVHRDPGMPSLVWKFVPRGKKWKGEVEEGKYKFKLHIKGRNLFMGLDNEKVGEQTQRDSNSYFVVSREKRHHARKWKIESNGDGTYKISCEMNDEKYYLACHSFYETDNRDVNSKYLMAHKDSNQPNMNWIFTEIEPTVYKIEQANNQWDLQGYKIGCHEFYQYSEVESGNMKRADYVLSDLKDYVNCIVHKNDEPRLFWKLFKH